LGLLSTEWNSKSHQLRVIIDLFPRYLPLGTFNANEIAGALCFIAPLLAGLATYNLNTKSGTIFRAACGFGFAAVLLAIVLGQSRFALAGTLLALGLMTPLLIRRWRWRIAAWGGLVLLVVLEVMIIRNVFSPARLDIQIDRDELSASLRLGIWEQAFNILTDLPLTGVGLNQFRDGRVRALYPVAGYETRILPHTHNELLQIGTDLGVPGLVIYIGWFVVIAFVLIRCYRRGIPQVKVLAVAVGGGLLAHAVFGLGDAIPIWDRFAFISWWLIALACATEIYQRLVSADNKA
ncbi:MAG: O-antigen ligase family protein, partial [Anaerolineae bacterium]|nr:O-antigen ligase family protein [Anaerolineae bacterium]